MTRMIRRLVICWLMVLVTVSGVAAQTTPPRAVQQSQVVNGYTITLTTTPATGEQGVLVLVLDPQQQPVKDATVAVEWHMVSMDMGTSKVVTVPSVDGRYDGKGAFSMAGGWEAQVTATPPGGQPLVAKFQLDVAQAVPLPPRPVSTPVQPPLLNSWRYAALGLLGLGVVALAAAQFWLRQRKAPVLMASWAFLAAGALSWLVPSWRPAETSTVSTAVERAKPLFTQNCQPCHGVAGKGDGPAARSLNPPPANLTAPHVDQHPDSQMYAWINDGFPGSAMPAFGRRLTSDQIWDLVDYVRYLREQAK